MDTDVELIKSLNPLSENKIFLCCQEGKYISTGLGFGAEAKNQLIRKNMKIYEDMKSEELEDFKIKPCPLYTTELIRKEGIEFPIETIVRKKDLVIYPSEYFDPCDITTKKIRITKNTIGIHHYESSWMTEMQKKGLIATNYYEKYKKRYGKRVADIWSCIYWARKENGGEGIWKVFNQKVKKLNSHLF